MGLVAPGVARRGAGRAARGSRLSARALTVDGLGAWLLKASGGSAETQAHAADGFAGIATRCVRPSYRTALVRPGQPVLLWISGSRRDLPAGIHAAGRVTGAVEGDRMPVRLAPLAHPVLRTDLVAHPDLASVEVLRMPAGSNPSFVTAAQLDALVAMSPELETLLLRSGP